MFFLFVSTHREYYVHDGLVTGGQYNSNSGCQPYLIKSCDHHIVGKKEPCGALEKTPACSKECRSGYAKSFRDDMHKGEKAYHLRTVADIAQDIMTNGPVEAAFTVYADFLKYKTGEEHCHQVFFSMKSSQLLWIYLYQYKETFLPLSQQLYTGWCFWRYLTFLSSLCFITQ